MMKQYLVLPVLLITLVSCHTTESPDPPQPATELESVDVPRFTTDGQNETVVVHFRNPVDDPVALRVYRFHYPLHPDIAPEPDTWSHRKQMEHMANVKAGKTSAYEPDSEQPRMEKILNVSSKSTMSLKPGSDRKTFTGNWTAKHGRIFFRVRVREQFLPGVYTSRVHCRRINMNSVEQLKEMLTMLRLPLTHGHGEMADTLLERIEKIYRRGHSLRFMLAHHQIEHEKLDRTLRRLKREIDQGKWKRAQSTVGDLLNEIREKENNFYTVTLRRNENNRTTVRMTDQMHKRPLSEYRGVEVYMKRMDPGNKPDPSKHMDQMRNGGHKDPETHRKHMKTRHDERIQDAIQLEKRSEKDGFEGSIPASWERVKLMVFYGSKNQYSLSQIISPS